MNIGIMSSAWVFVCCAAAVKIKSWLSTVQLSAVQTCTACLDLDHDYLHLLLVLVLEAERRAAATSNSDSANKCVSDDDTTFCYTYEGQTKSQMLKKSREIR